jgi:hypothetical protein
MRYLCDLGHVSGRSEARVIIDGARGCPRPAGRPEKLGLLRASPRQLRLISYLAVPMQHHQPRVHATSPTRGDVQAELGEPQVRNRRRPVLTRVRQQRLHLDSSIIDRRGQVLHRHCRHRRRIAGGPAIGGDVGPSVGSVAQPKPPHKRTPQRPRQLARDTILK